jgi:hypothetical protein
LGLSPSPYRNFFICSGLHTNLSKRLWNLVGARNNWHMTI